ncbi:hypothetical protein HDV05_004476 [Chytridiales sp. JEL 0842]|nr:hypothetical protein HDV05_004476 [Chytridiales sp. JEL 0842]
MPMNKKPFSDPVNTTPLRLGPPNQLRALGFKSVSYQKRQWFTNVCCISLCPLLMVLISAALGQVITNLIQNTSPIEEILFCSNNDSTSNGFPIFNTSNPGVYGFGVKDGKSMNIFRLLDLAGATGNPGAGLLSVNNPYWANWILTGVFWFGNSYPQNSPIYEKNALSPLIARIDSTYIPPPDSGWLQTLASLANSSSASTADSTALLQTFTRLQQQTWALVASSDPSVAPILGSRTQGTLRSAAQLAAEVSLRGSRPFTNFSTTPDLVTGDYGILGTMEGRYYVNFASSTSGGSATSRGIQGFTRVPYFQQLEDTVRTPEDIDVQLAALLRNVIADLAKIDKTVLTSSNPDAAKLIEFQLQSGTVVSQMPHGALLLSGFDRERLQARLVMHVGTDRRIQAASGFPSQGRRQMILLTQFTQSLFRAFNPTRFGGAGISQGVRAFPSQQSTKLDLNFGSIIGGILYPFGVSFLLPIFVGVLVKEKEERVEIMLTMNGVKKWAFTLAHYVTFYVLYILSTIVFLASGRGARLELFSNTAQALLVILFLIWGNVQITLAFLFSFLFRKTRIAYITTFLIILVSVIISISTARLFRGQTVPTAYLIWPPFAFYRALSVLNSAATSKLVGGYTLDMLQPGDEVLSCLIALLVGWAVYGLIAVYLAEIIGGGDFGVKKSWLWPFEEVGRWWKSRQRRKVHTSDGVGVEKQGSQGSLQEALAIQLDEADLLKEDDDVREERNRVVSGILDPKAYPLIIKNMRKIYKPRGGGTKPKLAVKDVTFAAERGTIFGLLGITGIYSPSSGVGLLGGKLVGKEQGEVNGKMGICPQFDILWEDLTICEHLYFYSRLKGVSKEDEQRAVQIALETVSLGSLEHRLTKRLSGGEKRRLSIAIALLGKPEVVFLDEPTGLDPEVRRLIWNIVQTSKSDKTIILTTHSMEEAEALCHRIGIMSHGTLRCIANPLRLKELYGSGMKLFFNAEEEKMEGACEWVEGLLPDGWRRVDAFTTSTSYEFPTSSGNVVPHLFEQIESEKDAHGILDWGISQTTLEEVFLRLISEGDADGGV